MLSDRKMRQIDCLDGDIQRLTSFREQIHETFLCSSRVGDGRVRRGDCVEPRFRKVMANGEQGQSFQVKNTLTERFL